MFRYNCIAFIFLFVSTFAFSQENGFAIDTERRDSLEQVLLLTPMQVQSYLKGISRLETQIVIGGYISSIYHEAVDSVKVSIRINGKWQDSLYCNNGLFSFVVDKNTQLVDVSVTHPDFHDMDTSFIPENEIAYLNLILEPRFKILLRGRVYAGNMPLEGVDVNIRHLDNEYHVLTRGCYYDKEGYWNCLYDGMFKTELIAETLEDSIKIFLSKDGMRSQEHGMKFNEYQGEVRQYKLKYEPLLPGVPSNDINLKLGFPFTSLQDDWFVSFSYYRQVNSQERLGYGMDASMYITNVSVPMETFEGLESTTADSSYINALIGPSLIYFFISPERRFFSSYAGCTFSINLNEAEFAPQLFVGSRIFLDLNKAISLELRYSEFDREVMHYTFNPYGKAFSGIETDTFSKLHATLGIQVVF